MSSSDDAVVFSPMMIVLVGAGVLLLWGISLGSLIGTSLWVLAATAFFSTRLSTHGVRGSFGAVRRGTTPWDEIEELIIMRSKVGWNLSIKTRGRGPVRSLPGFVRLLLSSVVAEVGRSVTPRVAEHVTLVVPKRLVDDLERRPSFEWPGEIEPLTIGRS